MTRRNQELIIGFDLDGVIVDHAYKKILLAAAYGWHLEPKQTPAEVIEKIVPAHQLREIKYLLYTHPDEALEQPLMPGVKAALRFLKSKNIKFYLVSRRKKHDLAQELLKLQNLWPHYFNETNAYFVDEIKDKAAKAKELGITHFIDDEPKTLAQFVSVAYKFLFDPHNVWPEQKNLHIVHAWPELIYTLNIL